MEYAPSIAEDAAVHQKFHNMHVGGVELGKAFIESDVPTSRTVWQGVGAARVVECGSRDSKAFKSKVRAVLDVVDAELGALKIEDGQLWAANNDPTNPAFTAYMYLKGTKCVGLCLVERLGLAFEVLASTPSSGTAQSPNTHYDTLGLADQPVPVTMGITRIWTSSVHRSEGLATRLLDCAQENFMYGEILSKERIAFSQPTESGVALARKWYGKNSGWHVYKG